MKKIITIISLIALSCSTIISNATNYYVATNGSDANNGTTLNTPFLTIAKAVSKATAPGDSIIVRSGTYTIASTIKITKPGTAAKHIVLTAYRPDVIAAYPNDARPLLDFSGMAVNSGNYGFQLTGANYWYIYGLKIKGAGDNGMNVNSTNYTTFEYCDFLRNRDAGFLIRNSSSHCLVLNCDAYENADLGTGTTTSGGNADGFAPKLDPGDSITFRGCRSWLNSDDGWDGYLKALEAGLPDGMTTILENCWTWRNGYYWLDGSTTTSMNGNGFKMGGSALKNQAHNFVLVNCLSFDNKANGFDQNNNAGAISLYNCTAYSNLGTDYGMNSSGVTYATNSTFTVENCTSLGTKGTTFKTGTLQTTNNFIKSATSTNFSSTDTTGVTARRKIDGSLPDIKFMHLQTSPKSTLIDAGTPLPNIYYYDKKGVPYLGTKPDIGCFESSPLIAISSFSPPIANTGTTVTIKGSGFTGASSVSFGGVAAGSYVVVNDSTITAIVANGASGSITVVSPSGTASKVGFIYCKPSVVNNLSLSGCNSVSYKSKVYSASTIVKDTVKNVNGCDSIYNVVTITVNKVSPVTNTLNQSNCDSIIYKGIVYKTTTSITDTVRTISGCDSIYNTVTLTINNLNLSGNVLYPNMKPIPNVTINLLGSTNPNMLATGSYNFGCLSTSTNYNITASKNPEVAKSNGITVLDISLIQNHILQKTLLNSPYKVIAADVNGDGKVSALDIVYIKRLILGMDTAFTNAVTGAKRGWVFVDSNYIFTNPKSPFPFKDTISTVSQTGSKTNQTFIGIKLGDVDWSWNPAKARILSEGEEVKQ